MKLRSVALYITILPEVASIATFTTFNGETIFKTFRTVSLFEAVKIAAKLGIQLRNTGTTCDILQGDKRVAKWVD